MNENGRIRLEEYDDTEDPGIFLLQAYQRDLESVDTRIAALTERRDELVRLITELGDDAEPCPLCDATFHQATQLAEHLKLWHKVTSWREA